MKKKGKAVKQRFPFERKKVPHDIKHNGIYYFTFVLQSWAIWFELCPRNEKCLELGWWKKWLACNAVPMIFDSMFSGLIKRLRRLLPRQKSRADQSRGGGKSDVCPTSVEGHNFCAATHGFQFVGFSEFEIVVGCCERH